MVATFTATPHPEGRPPYVELTFDSGSDDIQAIAPLIFRNGEQVRVPEAVASPGRTVTWRDYDASFDVASTYQFIIQTQETPTSGVFTENWTGTLTTKGWSSVSVAAQTTQTLRVNLTPTPSFESGAVGSWAADGAMTLAVSTAQSRFGTHSLKMTPKPTVVTNLVTDPTFTLGTAGWLAGAGTGTLTHIGGGVESNPTNAAGRTYINSPEYPVNPAKRYNLGLTVQNISAAGEAGFIYRWYNAAHSQIGPDHTETVLNMAENETGLIYTGPLTPPTGSAYVRVFAFATKYLSGKLGQYFGSVRIDTAWVTDGSVPTDYFHGNTPDTADTIYAWTGPVNNSPSTASTVIKNAGAKITLAGLTGGSTYTFTPYVYGTTAGTALTLKAVAGSSVFTAAAGTESPAWARPSLTFTMPSGVTAVTLSVLLTVAGVTGDRYIDAILTEQTDVVRPYFDGSTTGDIPTTALGTWTAAWASTAEASVSNARFSTVITNGSVTRVFSSFLSSGITFEGFYLPTAGTGATVTVTLDDGSTIVYQLTRTTTGGVQITLTSGSSFATLTRRSPFTGQLVSSFLSGRASLAFAETGASVSVPITDVNIAQVVITLDATTKMLPITVLPGVALTPAIGTADATLSPAGAWLIHPYFPALSIEVDDGAGCGDLFVTADTARTLTRDTVTSLLMPVGAKRQIAVTIGGRRDPEWEIGLSTQTEEAYDTLVALFDDAAPLRFDYPDTLSPGDFGAGGFGEGGFGIGAGPGADLCERLGMRIPKGWFSPGKITETRETSDWRDPLRRWAIPLSPVLTPTANPAA